MRLLPGQDKGLAVNGQQHSGAGASITAPGAAKAAPAVAKAPAPETQGTEICLPLLGRKWKLARPASLEELWQAMTPEARREGHEKVADAFEQYLFEGKAPSLALHGVFHMFDTRLYRPAIKT